MGSKTAKRFEEREARRHDVECEPESTECPDCEGMGLISSPDEHGASVTRECARCKGIGQVYL